MTILTVITKS